MNTKIDPRYFFFGILLLVGALNVIILWPFLTTIVLGISFSVVFYPVYEWLYKKTPWFNGSVAAFLTIFAFVLIICGPLFIIGTLVFQESTVLYNTIITGGTTDQYIQRANTVLLEWLPTSINFNLESKIADIVTIISSNLAIIFTATINTIFGFFLMLLAMFYFLKEGDHWRKLVIILSPLANTDDELVLIKLRNAINGVVRGNLFVAIVQGILMGIGLSLVGIPNAALLGVIAGITSLIPTIGTALVSVPIILFLFFTGETYNALALAIWATVIVGLVDNFLHPLIVGRKTDVPTLMVLLSVLGGIALLGPIGIIIGPLLVSLFYALISMYSHGKV